jgi:hypothetical protein
MEKRGLVAKQWNFGLAWRSDHSTKILGVFLRVVGKSTLAANFNVRICTSRWRIFTHNCVSYGSPQVCTISM